MTTDHSARYLEPGRATNVFNSAVAWLARSGVSILGSRELRVRGRRSGEWRTTPVNLLVLDGQRYLVAPRGQTQWVRNIRAAGGWAGGPSRSARSNYPTTTSPSCSAGT